MKSALVLLLTVFGTVVHAQTIYRCEDGLRKVTFQDRACPERSSGGASNSAAPGEPSATPRSAANLSTGPQYWQDDRSEQPVQRRSQAKVEAQAIASRVQLLLKPVTERRAAGYAENRVRCESAMQVAALCGKFAGTFYCDERGFRPVMHTAGDTVKPAVLGNGAKYQMERCALAAKGG